MNEERHEEDWQNSPRLRGVDWRKESLQAKFRRVTPEEFVAAREKYRYKAFLTPYTAEEMRGWRHYLTEDGAGFALTPDNDLVGLMHNPNRKGSGIEALLWAIHEGAETCDCLAGFLAFWYPMFGFAEVARSPWRDELAPRGWDYDRYGRNDVVYFGETPKPSRAPDRKAEPLSIAHALELLGLQTPPADSFMVEFMLAGLKKLIATYGEGWVRRNAPRLREELEMLSGM